MLRGACSLCVLLALATGCHPRYVVSGPEARRAVAELEARGEAVVRAHDEQHREVLVRVEADDGYEITRGDTVLERFGVTDRGMLEGEERLGLDYDHPGGTQVLLGALMLVPGLVASAVAARVEDDWTLALPVTGLAMAMDRSIAFARQGNGVGDEGFGPVGEMGAVFSALMLLGQLAGVGLILHAAMTWDQGREVEPATEEAPSLTVVPLAGPDGAVGGALGFSF